MAQLNFDATQVAPDMGFDPIPAGWYNCMMEKSDMKPTKAGDGMYLECVFTIIDGQYHGRKLFARINLRNPSPQATEIGFKQLSAIAHAVGVLHVQHSEQLHNIPLKVRVKFRPAEGQYEAANDITGYKNINEQVGEVQQSAPAINPNMPPPANTAPPGNAGWNNPAPPAQPAWNTPQQQPQQNWQGNPNTAPPVNTPPPANTGAPPQQPWNADNTGQPPRQPWNNQPPANGAPAPNYAPPAGSGTPPAGNPQTAAPPWQR